MRNTNWRPFIMFDLILFIGLGFLGMMFSRGGDVGQAIPLAGLFERDKGLDD